MIRLKDIAEVAGVSVMTVSKSLRDAPDISEGTKARIRLLTRQMGYVPDTMAQGMRTRKTHLIGVVIPAITSPIYARMILAIEECACNHGYDIILSHSLNQPEREESIIRRLISRRVDGMLIAPVYRIDKSVPIYEELKNRDVAVVILGHNAPFCAAFVNVQADDMEASAAATRHLIGLGHRKIAYFTGPTAAPWAHERLEGYRRAMREAQIEPDDRLIFSSGATIEEGEKAAEQLLAERPELTAIQAVNDLVAMGVGNVLRKHAIDVPRTISIIGFGNFLASEYYRVPLSTIRQPKHRLGLAAMASLNALMNGDRPENKQIASELIVRESTAPPPPSPLSLTGLAPAET
jgi:DNA-binding LacI/PurR family transcriptional regulator